MEYPQPPYEPQSIASKEERTWAMCAHLASLLIYTPVVLGNFIAPLVIWLMNRDTMPFVDDQAKESLNFQLTILLYSFLCVPFCFLFFIGFPMLAALAVFHVVASIIAAVKSQQGIAYRYPMTIRFL